MLLLDKFLRAKYRLGILLLLVGLAGLLSSCQKTYTIRMSPSNISYLKGKWIYLVLDDRTIVDSTQVGEELQLFKNIYSQRFSRHIAYIHFPEKGHIPLVVEPGEIEVDILNEEVSGTPLNVGLYQFSKEILGLKEEFETELNQARPSPDYYHLKKHIADSYYHRYIQICSRYLSHHTNDPLGIHIASLALSAYLEAEEKPDLDSIVEFMDTKIKENSMVRQQWSLCTNYLTTLPGKNFVDVRCKTSGGKETPLSHWLSHNSFTIICFVFPYSSFCRAEESFIAEALAKYKQHGLRVVAVSAWSRRQLGQPFVEGSGRRWVRLMDFENRLQDAYAIREAPHVMIIGPDRKIVARNLHQEEILHQLDSLYRSL